MVAAEDLHRKASAGIEDLVEIIELPSLLDVKPSKRLLKMIRFKLVLHNTLALTEDLSVVVGIGTDIVEVFSGLPIRNIEVISRLVDIRTSNIVVYCRFIILDVLEPRIASLEQSEKAIYMNASI